MFSFLRYEFLNGRHSCFQRISLDHTQQATRETADRVSRFRIQAAVANVAQRLRYRNGQFRGTGGWRKVLQILRSVDRTPSPARCS
jgi:hypothetical protein